MSMAIKSRYVHHQITITIFIQRSIETKTEVEWVKEENYMFDWAKFHDPIRKWLNDAGKIVCYFKIILV